MSDMPEVRAEIDERGRVSYHATCEGVLLSKGEQDEILRKFADLQSENAKLRELVQQMWGWLLVPNVGGATLYDIAGQMRELGIEVDE